MPLTPHTLNCSECGKSVKIKTNNPLLLHADRTKRNPFVLCKTHWNKLSIIAKQEHRKQFPVYLTN